MELTERAGIEWKITGTGLILDIRRCLFVFLRHGGLEFPRLQLGTVSHALAIVMHCPSAKTRYQERIP